MKAKKLQNKLLNKKKIITLGVIITLLIIIIVYFFYQNVNKNLKTGNNFTNKTSQEIEEYILNISSYEADIEVEVESNKNNTKYKIKQSYVSPNIEKQVIEEPSNIQGLQTLYDGSKLTITNTKLNLTTIYENYPYITDNYLWLNSFIQDYKDSQNRKLYEENDQVIMEVSLVGQNQYTSLKKLFINKQTGTITKLVVQDKNQKNIVYILYNEIKINSLKKEEVLAFKLKEVSAKQY